MPPRSRVARPLVGAVILTAIVACSDKNGTGPQQPSGDVDTYLQSLPSWSSFSPPVQDAPGTEATEKQECCIACVVGSGIPRCPKDAGAPATTTEP